VNDVPGEPGPGEPAGEATTPKVDDASSPDAVTGSGDEPEDAAAAALQRARAAARERGLRPGLKPIRGRRQGPQVRKPPREGRDPQLLGDQMDRLLSDRGWQVDVAVGSVMGRWPDIVGAEVAQHCTPVTFELGILTVRADSTAWMVQLQLLESTIMGRLEAETGKGTVTALKIVGPSAPSWSRGPRRSHGPGPRDTYG
jgi:predicted nucleic acid-binding Zn ribbon protein